CAKLVVIQTAPKFPQRICRYKPRVLAVLSPRRPNPNRARARPRARIGLTLRRMSSIWDLANPQLRDLPVYEPGKPIEETARELGAQADEIIKLASNENPLGPSPKALAARSEEHTSELQSLRHLVCRRLL